MGVLRVNQLSKSFGDKTIFCNASVELRHGDRVGLIGPNGCGKTTLLRCMLGLETPDSGSVQLPEEETVGYVEQEALLGEGTLYEELLTGYQQLLDWQQRIRVLEEEISGEREKARLAILLKEYGRLVERFERNGGYEYQNQLRKIASGLGFTEEDLNRKVTCFSGGQKTRICLARALTRNPDFLFLDEPTNHLDMEMIEWLEEHLTSYPGGVLVISHDRYFLNRVARKIIEIENGRLYSYNGNYDDYLKQKLEQVKAREKAYEKQQAWIARTEAYIRTYRAGIKARQARGRQYQLDRLQRLEAPAEKAALQFRFPAPPESAEEVAELREVTASYGNRAVFERLSLLIRRGERVGLIGPNGAGKTTLVKILLGEMDPSKGRRKLGSRVKVGYYAQEHENLNDNLSALDELTINCGLSQESAQHYLGAFLFRGEDVHKLVGELSGGERARLMILKLMLTGANFLVLDEPTNHLDIPTREAMEDAILDFAGTYLIISHDRYFLDRVADRLVELDNGSLTEYPGNYSYYRQKKAQVSQQAEPAPKRQADNKATVGPARPRKHKINQFRVRKLEEEIAKAEVVLKELEDKINDPASYSDPSYSKALAEEYARAKKELDAKYEEWLEASDCETQEA